DGEGPLQRGVAAQAARTSGAATNSRSMVKATHHPQNRLASTEDIPGHANARFKINCPRLSKSTRRARITRQNHAVCQISGAGDKGADEIGVGQQLPVSRIHRSAVGSRTGGSGWVPADAKRQIKQRRFCRIEARWIEV